MTVDRDVLARELFKVRQSTGPVVASDLTWDEISYQAMFFDWADQLIASGVLSDAGRPTVDRDAEQFRRRLTELADDRDFFRRQWFEDSGEDWPTSETAVRFLRALAATEMADQ